MRFEEFALSNGMVKAISDIGFIVPTPIQEESIPDALLGRDIIGQAQTGTGKTLAFGIPIVEKVDPLKRGVQAIVLTPTRELAAQVAIELGKVGKHKGLAILAVYGGESIQKQLNLLKKGAHIVVGTPGRIIDHIKRGTLKLNRVRFTVLDEADRMLDMGFIEDMQFILAHIPKECQIMLFSATIPSEIGSLAKRYLKEPVEVMVSKDTITVPQTRQMYFEVRESGKLSALIKLIDSEREGVFLIFRRTKAGVDELMNMLRVRNYNASALHGDYSQRERNNVVRQFRAGEVNILVATDVAARGLDIEGITHVVNYDVPQDAESYVHRIGRTGRAGRDGVAITFITHWEYGELRRIQAFSKTKIEKGTIPTEVRYARLGG